MTNLNERLVNAAQALVDKMPNERNLQHFHACNEVMELRAALSKVSPDHPAAQVAGDRLETTIAQFTLRAQHLLIEEQGKPNPDNALVGFLCDAVRLAREHTREATTPLERTCGWWRMPDSPDPMDYRMFRFKAGCNGAVATGVHPIYPDICPGCARPVRLLNPSPNDAVRWICPVCTTANDNKDERCCVGSCKGSRPNPWPPAAASGNNS